MNEKCKHRTTWLIGPPGLGTMLEWCYACGALRRLREVSPAHLVPSTYWQRPVGMGGGNPEALRPLHE